MDITRTQIEAAGYRIAPIGELIPDSQRAGWAWSPPCGTYARLPSHNDDGTLLRSRASEADAVREALKDAGYRQGIADRLKLELLAAVERYRSGEYDHINHLDGVIRTLMREVAP